MIVKGGIIDKSLAMDLAITRVISFAICKIIFYELIIVYIITVGINNLHPAIIIYYFIILTSPCLIVQLNIGLDEAQKIAQYSISPEN